MTNAPGATIEIEVCGFERCMWAEKNLLGNNNHRPEGSAPIRTSGNVVNRSPGPNENMIPEDTHLDEFIDFNSMVAPFPDYIVEPDGDVY